MSQRNDDMFKRLRASGFEGAVGDMLHAWLLSVTGQQSGQINDLWAAYMNLLGYTGDNPTMLYEWLADSGYGSGANTDHLSDRFAAFWADSAPMPVAPPP